MAKMIETREQLLVVHDTRAYRRVHSSLPRNDLGTLDTLKHRTSSGKWSLSESFAYCDRPASLKVSCGYSSLAAATVLEACTPLSVRLVLWNMKSKESLNR